MVLNLAAQNERRFARTAVLRGAGYTVVEVASESQAIGTVIHRNIDLAILDGDLPDCDLPALRGTLRRMRPSMVVVTAPAGDDRDLLTVVEAALRKDESRDDAADADVVTDEFGRIRGTSERGARLLNGSVRGLFQRNLVTFFDAGREVWHDAIRRAIAGERVQLTGRLRPKERRPVAVSVRVTSRRGTAGEMLEWAIAIETPLQD